MIDRPRRASLVLATALACSAAPEAQATVGFCALQFPALAVVPSGGAPISSGVFARVFQAGFTDQTGFNDPDPSIVGEFGIGPDGSDPSIDPTGWSFEAARPNPGYGPGSSGYVANDDEYFVGLPSTPLAAGTYDYAFRFSGDSGATFSYCDTGPFGSTDGYQPSAAGDLTVQTSAPPPGASPTLFFSEYVEGSANNKALEVFNASDSAIDLGAVQVERYTNGSTTPAVLALSSTSLPPGGVWLIADPSFDPALLPNPDQVSSVLSFNGDDAVVLRQSGQIVDAIGRIGEDPGSSWSGSGVSTRDQTLRRASYDCALDHGNVPFDPSVSWSAFPLDEVSDLGIETGDILLVGCTPAAVPTSSGLGRWCLLATLIAVATRIAHRRALA